MNERLYCIQLCRWWFLETPTVVGIHFSHDETHTQTSQGEKNG